MIYDEVNSYERSQPNHVDENSHIEDMDEDMLLDSDQKPYKRARQFDPDQDEPMDKGEERKSEVGINQEDPAQTCRGNDNDTLLRSEQEPGGLNLDEASEEERRLADLNAQLEEEILAVQRELSREDSRLREVKTQNNELDDLVVGIKELGEQLKNEQQYKKYAYVTK